MSLVSGALFTGRFHKLLELPTARSGYIRVKRPNREELLAVRSGEWPYGTLLLRAEERMAELEEVYRYSTLPEAPDQQLVAQLLVELRQELYR